MVAREKRRAASDAQRKEYRRATAGVGKQFQRPPEPFIEVPTVTESCSESFGRLLKATLGPTTVRRVVQRDAQDRPEPGWQETGNDV